MRSKFSHRPIRRRCWRAMRLGPVAVKLRGQRLRVELVSGPAGLVLRGDGLLAWQPTAQQLGTHDLVLRYSSPTGSSLRQSARIRVQTTTVSRLPEIVSEPKRLTAVETP